MQRLYLSLRGPGHVTVTVQGHSDRIASEAQGNMKQCIWLMRSSKKHIWEHCFEKKRNLAYPEVMSRDGAGFE